MERLTEKIDLDKGKPSYCEPTHSEEYKTKNKHIAINKLGQLEDAEEKLEMPIDKFARIFMEGIWTKKFGLISRYKISIEYYDEGTFVPKTCRIKTYVDGEWWQYFDLKDYGKTWCLASEHEQKTPRIEDLPEEVRRAVIK